MNHRFPPAFEAFVRPARDRPALWRLGLGLCLALAVYLGLVAGLLAAARAIVGPAAARGWMRGLAEAADPASTLFLLATFLGMALGPILAAWLLHRRGPASLIGPLPRARRDFARAVGGVAAVYVLALGVWLIAFRPAPGLDPATWALLLPLGLAGIAVQTGAEELLFRGYLQQQLAARFRSPAIWLVLPSVLFGLVHYDPDSAGGNAWLIVLSATAFGLAAADLTALTGSLGAAWGFHFANNAFAILLIATAGTIEGLALYITPYAADETGWTRLALIADLAIMVLAWAVLRRILRP